jgi:hypothetical protein
METPESLQEQQATAGLGKHDEDRAHSMADEGGASGMAVEAQQPLPVASRRRGRGSLALVLAAAAGIVAGALWIRYRS